MTHRLPCKGTGKRGHIVAETLLLMTFPCQRKLGNICCGHKMFLNKIRNNFCVPDPKFVSATNVARAGKRGNICVGNNVSSFASTLMLSRAKKLYTVIPVLSGPHAPYRHQLESQNFPPTFTVSKKNLHPGDTSVIRTQAPISIKPFCCTKPATEANT